MTEKQNQLGSQIFSRFATTIAESKIFLNPTYKCIILKTLDYVKCNKNNSFWSIAKTVHANAAGNIKDNTRSEAIRWKF